MPARSVAPAPVPAPPAAAAVTPATKLHIPVPRPGLVPRTRLISMLTSGRGRKLTLLTAPPGSGKTTLLSEWAACDAEDRPFAWLSLDEGDNDPVRFWGLVIQALRALDPGVGAGSDPALRAPGTSLTRHVLPLLVNELVECALSVVVVLDDYHLVRNREVHESVAFLLDHLPGGVELAIATRSDPALPLPRLRVRGEIAELRASDLRFDADDAAQLLNGGLGLSLDPQEIGRLQQRTEGWVAGLQLAGLSLRGREDTAAFIASFTGDDRQITDYLGTEVLDAQPRRLLEFLLRTSVLDRLHGSLCDAVTGGEDGVERLAQLDRENLFVVPLDSSRRWYRYHHLFAALLRARLEREEPGAVPDLHRRAAAWYAEGGLAEDAIRHSLGGGDLDRASDLVAVHWHESFNRGHLTTVARWLDALPPERLRADSRLWLARAWTEMDLGRLEALGPWLEAGVDDHSDGGAAPDQADDAYAWAQLLRGLHHFKCGDLGSARESASWVRAARPGRPTFWLTVASCLDGLTKYWAGDERPAATIAFKEGLGLAEADANGLASVYALGHLALLALERGDLAEGAARLDRFQELRDREPELDEHFTALVAHVATAKAAEGEARLDDAAAELDRAVDLARRGAGVLELGDALARRGQIARAGGEPELADELLDEASTIAAVCPDPGRLARLAPPRRAHRDQADRDELSERELGVLRLLPSELSLREIGSELYVSLNTVKTHVRNIYMKLGASSREEAVARAHGAGLLQRPRPSSSS